MKLELTAEMIEQGNMLKAQGALKSKRNPLRLLFAENGFDGFMMGAANALVNKPASFRFGQTPQSYPLTDQMREIVSRFEAGEEVTPQMVEVPSEVAEAEIKWHNLQRDRWVGNMELSKNETEIENYRNDIAAIDAKIALWKSL